MRYHPVFNNLYPELGFVSQYAEYVGQIVFEEAGGRLNPRVEVVDKGLPSAFSPEDKHRFQVRIDRVRGLLGYHQLRHPRETLRGLVQNMLRGYSR